MNTAKHWPRITVVTPSYQQAHFLEATLRSVLGQEYPNLNYIVMDGGSTDGSAEIIAAHAGRLSYWVSEKDGGQAEAINRAFERADGEIYCWLNSDDIHLPDTLWRVAEYLRDRLQEPVVLTGSNFTFWDQQPKGTFEPAPRIDQPRLARVDYLVQPATFWTAAAWRKTGALNAKLSYTFDWEWFLRAHRAGCEFRSVGDVFAGYRMHGNHKSSFGGDKRRREIVSVLREFGDSAFADLCEWLLDHPATWPWIHRAGGWHFHGIPAKFAMAPLPALWTIPSRFQKERILEAFHFLHLASECVNASAAHE